MRVPKKDRDVVAAGSITVVSAGVPAIRRRSRRARAVGRWSVSTIRGVIARATLYGRSPAMPHLETRSDHRAGTRRRVDGGSIRRPTDTSRGSLECRAPSRTCRLSAGEPRDHRRRYGHADAGADRDRLSGARGAGAERASQATDRADAQRRGAAVSEGRARTPGSPVRPRPHDGQPWVAFGRIGHALGRREPLLAPSPSVGSVVLAANSRGESPSSRSAASEPTPLR